MKSAIAESISLIKENRMDEVEAIVETCSSIVMSILVRIILVN
jgi:hypothetical protein